MSLILIENIVFNIYHIMTIKDNPGSEGCIIRMSNRDKFFLTLSKEEVLSQIKNEISADMEIQINDLIPKEVINSVRQELKDIDIFGF